MTDPYAPLKAEAARNLTGRASAGYDETAEAALAWGWQQSTAAGLEREREDLLATWVDRFKTETGVDVWAETQKRNLQATREAG